MRRKLGLLVLGIATLAQTPSMAGIDTTCPTAYQTSAIAGIVENAVGTPLAGIKVEILATNSERVNESATTNAQGRYRICAGQSSGIGHNTYDVRARDLTAQPLYGIASQVYTTYTSPTEPADFTPESGHPLLYLTTLSTSPREISTATGAKTVTWTVRSKAPSTTEMKLTLGHLSQTFTLTAPTQEAGGPAAGGWNVWTKQATFNASSPEALYSASARGFQGSTQTTQLATENYMVDNRKPLFGPQGQSAAECGPGATAPGFSPGAPGTTNRQPITTYGVCDFYSGGAKSGVDPFSVRAEVCQDLAMTVGCSNIKPVLSVYSMLWWPETPLAYGSYYLRYTAADRAGNEATSTTQALHITQTGGQKPVFSAIAPSNLASGDPRGVVIGSALTQPNSQPQIGFRVSDADGQDDLSPGSLRVRIYYMSEDNLVYDYDPTAPWSQKPDPLTKKAGGTFDQQGGLFRATGLTTQITEGTLPGRYFATASITDRGGNTSSIAWHWLLVWGT